SLLIDCRRRSAAIDVWNSVLLGSAALRLHQRRRVSPEQEVHLVHVDQSVGQADGGRLGGGVVEQLQGDWNSLSAHQNAARLHRLFESELISLLVKAADARLRAGQRERGADDDLVGQACRCRRGRLLGCRLLAGGGRQKRRGQGQRETSRSPLHGNLAAKGS